MAKRKKNLPAPARVAGAPTADRPAAAAAEAIPERLWKTVLAATLAVYAVFQILYLTATPLQSIGLPDNLPAASGGETPRLTVGIGPDEKEHFLYLLSIANRGALPAPDPARRTSPEGYVSYQAQHPPLFYALGALVYKVTSPLGLPAVWYVLRALCAVCGATVVVLAARAARTAFPDRPLVALATAPCVAFLPMFGHMTGNLSNEPLAMVFGAWAWLQMARMVRGDAAPGIKDAVLLGATLGLAAVTRLTALLWLPAAAIVLAHLARRREGRISGRAVAACAGCFALLAAPWFVHNLMEYGTPVLRTFHRPLLEGISLWEYLADPSQPIQPRGFPQPIVVTPLTTMLWYASTSWVPFWLIQFYVPGGIQGAPAWQAIALLVVVFAVLLLFLHASRSKRETGGADPGARTLLWAAGAATAFCVLVLIQQQLWTDWNVLYSPGRYTVAAVPATSLLFLFALSTTRAQPGGVGRAGALAIAAALLLLNVYTVSLVRQFYADHPAQPDVQPISQVR